MEASSSVPTSRNAFIPVVLMLGLSSIVCSFAISNYWGMSLAIVALLLTQFTLQKAGRSIWILCVALASIGFALGLAALLMRLVIDRI